MADEEPSIKRFKHSIISDHLLTENFQKLLRTNWKSSSHYKSTNIELITSPFRICKISNFIKNEAFMDELKNELSDIKSRRQGIDLYCFEQTSDLANVDSDNIKQLYNVFSNEMREWMMKNTEIDLNRTVSMSSSCYYDTDYLLCHDDNMGDRRIAFILYLSKNWTLDDGGSLDLFDTDSNGFPRNIVKSLIPEYNSLVFFEVTSNSYHQVAEVTSADKSRWTINGWFHGPLKQQHIKQPRPELSLTYYEPCDTNELLSTWIMDSYLCTGIMKGIREDVEKKSYTFLSHFLKEDIYKKLSNELISDDIKWTRVGPADLRNYEIADVDTLPGTIRSFYDMFKSIEIFRLLKEYTELDLVPDGKCMKPKMIIELQRWSKGCYTLICDKPADDSSLLIDDNDDDKFNFNSSVKINDCNDDDRGKKYGDSNNGFDNNKFIGRNRGDSISSNEDDDKIKIVRVKGKKRSKKDEASCSTKTEDRDDARSPPLNPDSEDSQVSDIGDYLSDQSEISENTDLSINETSNLDVIMQFHTSQVPEDETIDYVDPKEQDGALIHIPPEDNHLCLVYKAISTCRLQKYVNHYCEGYFYNLICTYYE